MSIKRQIISFILIIIISVFCVPIKNISSYYFDAGYLSGTVNTSKLEVDIENLQVTDSDIVWSESLNTVNDGVLRINKSDIFSFTVNNLGQNTLKYSLELQIAWDNDLSESGKLLIYPYNLDDQTILANLDSGIYDNSIIGIAPDDKEIILSTGVGYGMSETVDSGVLGSLNGAEGVPSSKDYKFKIFFYSDSDISINAPLYHNKDIEVNINLKAELFEKDSDWTADASRFFRVKSVMDNIFPIIHEIPNAKTYFITQSSAIDLSAYAQASDTFDGDISGSITISSYPEFNPQKAGTYNIYYNVKNSFGNAAVPLKIKIVIWDFVKIISGNYHTLILTSHGKVYTWGYNISGQLGDGATAYVSQPKKIELLDKYHIIDIAAGNESSYALTSEGQAYAWGRGDEGRLGHGTTASRNTPQPVAQPDGVKFIKIESRYNNAAGLTADGDVYTWGYGLYGAAGTGTAANIMTPVKILSGIKTVAMGRYNGIAVTYEDEVYTWGDNLHGQLGNGAAMAVVTTPPAKVPFFTDNNIKISSVSAGLYHMSAVTDEGKLYTWGYGAEGRLANGSVTDRNTPQEIAMPSKVSKAAAAYFHTGILADDGTVYFAGQNAYGKHGTGNTTNHLTPYQPNGNLSGITDIALAYETSFVLIEGREVYGMGYGGTGILGTGNSNSSNVPVKWAFTPPEPV